MEATCFVDDFAAIIAGVPWRLPGRHYTTSLVTGEVRDPESRRVLEMLVETGRLEIVEVSAGEVERVLGVLPRGLAGRLSRADASLLALARRLEGCPSVVVVTDDYALQEAALRLGLAAVPVRYRGSRRLRRGRGGAER